MTDELGSREMARDGAGCIEVLAARGHRLCYKHSMRFHARLGSGFVVAALLFGASLGLHAGAWSIPEAQAHTYVEMSLDFLAQRASRVVIATPTDEMSAWESTDSGRRIVTYHRLQVESNLVGEGDTEIWVRRLGGIVNDIGQRVHGTAPLRRGKTVLLFLLARSDGAFSVIGMEQGCFPVGVDKNKKHVIESRRFVHPAMPSKRIVHPASMLEGVPIPEARRIILEARRRHAK